MGPKAKPMTPMQARLFDLMVWGALAFTFIVALIIGLDTIF